MSRETRAVDDPELGLPNDAAAERALIGGAILQGNVERLRGIRNALYVPRHQRIADALIEIADAGRPIDAVALRAELDRRGNLLDVGGPAYLAALVDGVVRGTNPESCVEVIENRAWRRAIQARAQGLCEAITEGLSDRDILELLDDLAEEHRPTTARLAPVDLFGPGGHSHDA